MLGWSHAAMNAISRSMRATSASAPASPAAPSSRILIATVAPPAAASYAR
jgi:hypothetical protein